MVNKLLESRQEKKNNYYAGVYIIKSAAVVTLSGKKVSNKLHYLLSFFRQSLIISYDQCKIVFV